jgi:hypothetical protein
MKEIQVRILDDEPGKREGFREKIRSTGISDRFEISLLEPREIKPIFKVLLGRQKDFRERGFWNDDERIALDDTDIFIVDNELRDFFESTGIFTSADEVAYIARCFSSCKLIVVVNRTAYNPFDTTGNFSYLGQFEAFSDIEIGQTQLASKALWETGQEEFHPWYWFVLPKWLEEFDQRVKDAEEALRTNASILDFFGLSEVREWLPRRILQTLGDGETYTFGEFVRSSSSALSPKDRANLQGTLSGETIHNLAPVVAARLWKWLEVQLLPELDILIDAPHLVTRFPSLLEGDHENIETWNAITVRHTKEIPGLKMNLVEKASCFLKSHWLTRPVWYWRKIMNDENIPDVSQPWNIEYVPFAFCEDTSRFAPEEDAKSYRASVDSPFGMRHIRKLKDVDYVPLNRLAF